jgi:hypothetical protein
MQGCLSWVTYAVQVEKDLSDEQLKDAKYIASLKYECPEKDGMPCYFY